MQSGKDAKYIVSGSNTVSAGGLEASFANGRTQKSVHPYYPGSSDAR